MDTLKDIQKSIIEQTSQRASQRDVAILDAGDSFNRH
jgi:hypothetical protein